MISIIEKYHLVPRGGDGGGGGGGGGGGDSDAANYIGGSDIGGYSGSGNTTYTGGGGKGRDTSADDAAAKAAADNAARIAAEKEAYDAQQKEAADKAAADEAMKNAIMSSKVTAPTTFDTAAFPASITPATGAFNLPIDTTLMNPPAPTGEPSFLPPGASQEDITKAARQIDFTAGGNSPLAGIVPVLSSPDMPTIIGQPEANVPIPPVKPADLTPQPDYSEAPYNTADYSMITPGAPKMAPFGTQSSESISPLDKYGTAKQLIQNAASEAQAAQNAANYTLPSTPEAPQPSIFENILNGIVSSAVAAPIVTPPGTTTEDTANKPILPGTPMSNVPFPIPRPPDLGLSGSMSNAVIPPSVPTGNIPLPPVRPEDLSSSGATSLPSTGTPAPGIPLPIPRPSDLPAPGPLDSIVTAINMATADQINKLEDEGKFAGGSRDQVAAALGVNPEDLQARIVTRDGEQKVDYYTKDLSSILSDMVGAVGNIPSAIGRAISGISGPAKGETINAYSARFPEDVKSAIQGDYLKGVPSSDWINAALTGPTGPVSTPVSSGGGGGKSSAPITPAPVIPPPVAVLPPAPTPVAYTTPAYKGRTYLGAGSDLYGYGYGPERQFFAAKGGAVSPLNAMRK